MSATLMSSFMPNPTALPCLPAHNGINKGLTYTDNPGTNAVSCEYGDRICILLLVNGADRRQTFILPWRKRFFKG